MEVALQTAKDLKLSKTTMRELEALNLPKVEPLSPKDIKEIRSRAAASQAVMAAFLNVSVSTVQKWERGEVHPQQAALKLLNLANKWGLKSLV